MRTFVILDFSTTCKCLATRSTDEWLVTGVHYLVHFQIVRRCECLVTHIAHVLPDTSVGAFVLRQILVTVELLRTLGARIRSLPIRVDFHVGIQRVFRGKVLGAVTAFIRSIPGVHVLVFLEQIA